MAFNGEECAYNETTNVQTTYRGKTLGWTNRRVTSYNGIQFSYDGQGRRIAKGDISYIYDSQGRLLKQSNDLEFFYDHNGVSSVKHGENTYFYRKDILGNVIALLDTSGAVVVKYTYDAWGNNEVSNANNVIISDANHIGNLNPFRYRGYYYDTDTKLYYLKSRYYDPEAGRFISQDGVEYLDPDTINGLNLYAYCGNNPVSNVDPNGNAWWHWLVVGIVAAVAVVAVVAGTILSAGTAAPLLGAVLVGAGSGFLMAAGFNVISQGVENNWNFEQMNAWDTLKAGGIGAAVGAVSGFASSYVGSVLGTTGHLFGNALSNTTIAGLNVGKAFTYLGGSQMISTVFSLIGKITGSILGGAIANELANQWFSINPTHEKNLEEALKGVVGDYILLGIYKVFKWVRQ